MFRLLPGIYDIVPLRSLTKIRVVKSYSWEPESLPEPPSPPEEPGL